MEGTVSILMYHQVGDFPPMREHRSTYCHHRRFAAQMALLSRLRYRVISLDDALQGILRKGELPSKAVVLTFDDGYENFSDYAFPVLRRYGFPATVYLLSGLLGQPSSWFAADGRDCPPLLGRESILRLSREDISFGSHGISHVKLAEVEEELMRREIFQSRRELTQLLGLKIEHFCYPYGSHSPKVIETVREAGYASAVTCVRGAAAPGEDPLQLPRKAISYGDTLVGFFWKLAVKNRRKHPPFRLG